MTTNDTNSSNHHDLYAGQDLWVGPAFHVRCKNGYPVRISRVGRKWAELEKGGRANIITLEIDGKGYSSPGRLYKSEQEWIDVREKDSLWSSFKRNLPSNVPAVTTETLRNIAETLGINL